MIHSTSTTIMPMTIQVTAVEDMESGSSEGDGLWPCSIYGAAGAKGSGAPTASRNAPTHPAQSAFPLCASSAHSRVKRESSSRMAIGHLGPRLRGDERMLEGFQETGMRLNRCLNGKAL